MQLILLLENEEGLSQHSLSTPAPCCRMEKPQAHEAKREKTVTKEHRMYDAIYRKRSDRQVYRDRR